MRNYVQKSFFFVLWIASKANVYACSLLFLNVVRKEVPPVTETNVPPSVANSRSLFSHPTIPEFLLVFGDYLFFSFTSFVLLTGIWSISQAYNAPFAFFLLARIKIKAKIFGSTILNMYLCARFSTMKSIITTNQMFCHLHTHFAFIRHIHVVIIGDNPKFTSAAAEAFYIGQHPGQT